MRILKLLKRTSKTNLSFKKFSKFHELISLSGDRSYFLSSQLLTNIKAHILLKPC